MIFGSQNDKELAASKRSQISKHDSIDSMSKPSRSQNQSLMEKLFQNLKDLSEEGSVVDLKGKLASQGHENVFLDNVQKQVQNSYAQQGLVHKMSERSFGQSVEMSANHSHMQSHLSSFVAPLKVSSVQLPPKVTGLTREKSSKQLTGVQANSYKNTLSERISTEIAPHIELSKRGSKMVTPVDFGDLKKPSSIFYTSNDYSSLDQFTKYEEAVENEVKKIKAVREEHEDEVEQSYESSKQGSEGKRLTIFGQPLVDSSCEEDQEVYDNHNPTFSQADIRKQLESRASEWQEGNKTIIESSEQREDSGIYISSEDKKSLLRRLKENFEQNNAFDCVQFSINQSQNHEYGEDSIDIDDRRVLFESEVRKQIHRNIPFEQTEEYAKMELIHKLSKNNRSSVISGKSDSKPSIRQSVNQSQQAEYKEELRFVDDLNSMDESCRIYRDTSFSEKRPRRGVKKGQVHLVSPSVAAEQNEANKSRDVSRSCNRSISMRSMGEKQMEELKNMFYDSNDSQEYRRQEEEKKKEASLVLISKERKSTQNNDYSCLSGLSIHSGNVTINENLQQSKPSFNKNKRAPQSSHGTFVKPDETSEVKIQPRPIIGEVSYSSSATLALQELTHYYLDQSQNKSFRNQKTSQGPENSMKIGLTPIQYDPDTFNRHSTFFSGDAANPFPSETSLEPGLMLENLTEVLKSDVKAKPPQVVLMRAEQIEEMRKTILQLEKENKNLKGKVTVPGHKSEATKENQFSREQARRVEYKPEYNPNNQGRYAQAGHEIRTFKDLVELAPKSSYSQIHRKKTSRHF